MTGAETGAGTAIPAGLEASSWSSYRNGPAFLQHLNAGESPRAVLSALQGYGPGGWPRLIAEAVAAVRLSGRGAVVVVPDYRDLDRVEAALLQLLPAGDIARLTADDGQTPRYRSFLRILSGAAGVAVGTRSAAYAPVHNLGLVVCWDDGDDLHIEQRSPYAHSREVLLLRAEQEGAACLLAGHTRSTETQRLVEAGWARPVEADRAGRPPDRSAGAEHRRQLRTRTRPAGPDRPAAGRRLARRQGRPGTRPGPGPGGPGGLRAVACLRKLPRTGALHRLQRAAGHRRGQRELRRAAVPLVFDAGAGLALQHVQRGPAPARRHGGPAHGRGTGPRLPGQAGDHLVRGPGAGHGSGLEGPGGGHRRRGAGRRRRLRGGTAARRRFAAAPRKPAGGGGRRPALVQRRGPGPPRGRRRPGGHHRGRRRRRRAPCCAGTLPATPSGNWPCARNCSCPRPSGSPPSPAAGPPSGISARPSSSSWPRRGSCCGPPVPAPLVMAGACRPGRTPGDSSGAAGEDVRTLLFIPYGQAAHVTGCCGRSRPPPPPNAPTIPCSCGSTAWTCSRQIVPGGAGRSGPAPATSGPVPLGLPGRLRAAPRPLRRRPAAGGRTRPS